jgi:hypothetical protein
MKRLPITWLISMARHRPHRHSGGQKRTLHMHPKPAT